MVLRIAALDADLRILPPGNAKWRNFGRNEDAIAPPLPERLADSAFAFAVTIQNSGVDQIDSRGRLKTGPFYFRSS